MSSSLSPPPSSLSLPPSSPCGSPSLCRHTLSANVLVAAVMSHCSPVLRCSSSLRFSLMRDLEYLQTRVFLHAINTPRLNFPKPPQGRYYLVDNGYPDKDGYLIPYPKIRYHQSQFEQEPPTNRQEAFNRAHSSLRSCIERSFGVLKKRWKILSKMPQFSVETQIDVIMVAFVLHNYIRKNSQDDMMFTILEQHPNYTPEDELPDIIDGDTSGDSAGERSTKMKEIRNNIANLLWDAR